MNNYQVTTNNSVFNGLTINTGDGNLFCYTQILQDIFERFNHMTQKHNKVLFIRFDLHFPVDYHSNGGNDEVSLLFKLFKENLLRHCIDIQYVWVREQNTISEKPHYHGILLLNGNKVQNYFPILEKVSKTWGMVLRQNAVGCVNYCNNYNGVPVDNGIMIRRPSSLVVGDELLRQQYEFNQAYQHCFAWASYLAKVNQKSSTPFGIRRFNSSRIPKQLMMEVMLT